VKAALKPLIERAAEDLARAGFKQHADAIDAATRTAILRSDQFLRAREALRALRDAAELTLAETFKRAAAAAP